MLNWIEVGELHKSLQGIKWLPQQPLLHLICTIILIIIMVKYDHIWVEVKFCNCLIQAALLNLKLSMLIHPPLNFVNQIQLEGSYTSPNHK